MENITLIKILNILKKHFKFLVLFSIIGLVVGVLYASIIFKPVYKSTAKLLIRDNSQPGLLTATTSPNRIAPLTRDGNPTLTQMNIITSGILANTVWQKISAKYHFNDDPQLGAQLMQKAITVTNPVGTDIIEITASWTAPGIAKDIANYFVEAYITSNIDGAKKGIRQTQNTITNQLVSAEKNLASVRDQIKRFRQANSTVDLEAESSNIVTQISEIENRYNEIAASASAEADKVMSIANRLGIDWQKAINSVALGYNTNLSTLQSRLGEAQEELAGLTSKYTESHPAVMAVNARINQIKKELSKQIKASIGDSLNEEGIIISDPVRTGMMESLVNSEATYRGLRAQSNLLRSAIAALQARRAAIPNKQQVLSNLLQEEATWTSIVNTLKANQVEANLRESEIISNISIVDFPSIPPYPAFPSRSHIVILFTVFGALLGTASILITYLTRDTYEDAEQIEEELRAPVLGIIPWLDKQVYNEPDALLAIDNSATYYALAYQRLVSSLRIKGYNSGVKALVFTSTEFSKTRSPILMNIAYGLTRAGQSVIIVDADFRTPSVHSEFKLHTNDQFNLGELLININKEISENGEFNWKYLSYYTQEVTEAPNLHILANNCCYTDPYEFLHSPSFNLLAKKLKEKYDWVIFDTPPALAVPDGVTVGSYADGAVIITGLDTSRTAIKKVYRLFSNNHIPVFGVIARELQSGEAASSNEYIKQVISRMMPQEDGILIDK